MDKVLRFFFDDKYDAANFEPTDDEYTALGSLLTGDFMTVDTWVLDFLDAVVRLQTGDIDHWGWSGNGWDAELDPDGVHLQDLHTEDWNGDYTLDFVREVTLDYLCFLLPDPDERSSALARWETSEKRPHAAGVDIGRGPG